MPNLFGELRQQLKQRRHRVLLILSGTPEWQQSQLPSPLTADETWLWLGNEAPSQAPNALTRVRESELKHWLGQEVEMVFINARDGFSANALGILSGLVRAGGLMVLLTPPHNDWKQMLNPANRRFLNTPYRIEDALPCFNDHLLGVFSEHAVWLDQQLGWIAAPADTAAKAGKITLPTEDQCRALSQIHSVAFGHRKRPLLIRADRGRGKTSVLGRAAVELLQQGKQTVVITAARYDQAAIAFAMAQSQIDSTLIKESKPGYLAFSHQGQLKTLQFRAPDDLIQNPISLDVLMVDEAAHLPNPMLQSLLSHYHRIVFATTLHGYEGCGRGFELRFTQTLNRLTPNWKSLALTQPVRWAEHDPLEAAINQALLLDAEAPELTNLEDFISSEIHCQAVDAAALNQNPQTLKSLFGLLVQAHYQTSPDDLQQLLSAPNLKIWQVTWRNKVVAVALGVAEGGLSDEALSEHSALHGHLVPQLVDRFYANRDLLTLSSWRIMRIAVHPQLQGRGVGTQLLKTIQTAARSQQIDFLSSSFGATDRLASFWFDQGFQPVHLGQKRDKASGTFNLVVAQGLNARASHNLTTISQLLARQLPHAVLENAGELSAPLLLNLAAQPAIGLSLTTDQAISAALLDYAADRRPFDAVSGQLWAWSYQNADRLKRLEAPEQAVWVDKVMKKQPWRTVAQAHNLAGKKGVEQALKAALGKLMH